MERQSSISNVMLFGNGLQYDGLQVVLSSCSSIRLTLLLSSFCFLQNKSSSYVQPHLCPAGSVHFHFDVPLCDYTLPAIPSLHACPPVSLSEENIKGRGRRLQSLNIERKLGRCCSSGYVNTRVQRASLCRVCVYVLHVAVIKSN